MGVPEHRAGVRLAAKWKVSRSPVWRIAHGPAMLRTFSVRPAAAGKAESASPLEVQHRARAKKGVFVVLSVGPHDGQPQAFVLQLRDVPGGKPAVAK